MCMWVFRQDAKGYSYFEWCIICLGQFVLIFMAFLVCGYIGHSLSRTKSFEESIPWSAFVATLGVSVYKFLEAEDKIIEFCSWCRGWCRGRCRGRPNLGAANDANDANDAVVNPMHPATPP